MMFRTTHGVWSWSAGARRGVLLVAVVLLAGCSSEEPTASVSGKVTLDGAPVSAGTVLLMSDDGQAASAELQSDGSYTLNCRLGSFKVAVSPPPPADPLSNPDATTSAAVEIPQKYHDFGGSGLTTEVKEASNTFDISLTSK
jgi:hypothetical protein